jgi:hypothetical protein
VVKKRFNEEKEEDRTANMVKSLKMQLIREWRAARRERVGLFQFVIDPTSFANTVENMFHLCFLIQAREVAMFDNPDSSLPELFPLDTDMGKKGAMVSDFLHSYFVR